MRTTLRNTAIAVTFGALALTTQADAAPAGIKVGVLSCHVASGWGYIIASSRGMQCMFHGSHGTDRYVGQINKLGMDIGYTSGGRIVWNVVAPTSDMRPGALQGNYAGATASATVGVGLGAHALIGGLDKSIALQPLSVEGNTGLNVAAGVGEMSLKAVRPIAYRDFHHED